MKTFANIKLSACSHHAEHSRESADVMHRNSVTGDQHGPRFRSDSSDPLRYAYVDAYADMMKRRLAEGYDAYILTFMYHPLASAGRGAIMTRAVEEAYRRVVPHVLRNPNSARNQAQPLIWLAFPDYPVPKRDKQTLRDVSVNDGRHIHVIVLVPPNTRLDQPFDAIVEWKRHLFLTEGVQRVAVERFVHSPDRAMRYFAKSFTRGRIDFDDIIYLPRSKHELSRPGEHPNHGRQGQVRRAPPIDQPVPQPMLTLWP